MLHHAIQLTAILSHSPPQVRILQVAAYLARADPETTAESSTLSRSDSENSFFFASAPGLSDHFAHATVYLLIPRAVPRPGACTDI